MRLADLVSFTEDVQNLLRGDTKEVDTQQLEVSIQRGSLLLETEPIQAPKLFADLAALTTLDVMDQRLDGKRREVIQKWQKIAQKTQDRHFKINADFLPKPIVISFVSDFRSDDADQWVRVERYIRGEILNLGGSTRANAHVRLPDGSMLKVDADKSVLREDATNRLYKTAMLRIRAEYNVMTRELRNASLISFVEHSNKIDEAEYRRMTQRGQVAWKDVPDASSWVEELRGGSH